MSTAVNFTVDGTTLALQLLAADAASNSRLPGFAFAIGTLTQHEQVYVTGRKNQHLHLMINCRQSGAQRAHVSHRHIHALRAAEERGGECGRSMHWVHHFHMQSATAVDIPSIQAAVDAIYAKDFLRDTEQIVGFATAAVAHPPETGLGRWEPPALQAQLLGGLLFAVSHLK